MQEDLQESNSFIQNSEELQENKRIEHKIKQKYNNNRNANRGRNINPIDNNRFEKNGYRQYNNIESRNFDRTSTHTKKIYLTNETPLNQSSSRAKNIFWNRRRFNNEESDNFRNVDNNNPLLSTHTRDHHDDSIQSRYMHNYHQNHFYKNDNNYRMNQNMANRSNDYRSNKNVTQENSYKNMHGKFNNTKNGNIKTLKAPNFDTSKLDQRESLIHELKLSLYECMICMNTIQRETSVWSCDKCFHIFHLHCINKWAQLVDKSQTDAAITQSWRCPACQNENMNNNSTRLVYTCFCSKQTNPTFKHGSIPHSCGDVCSKTNQMNTTCPHLCSLLCHPGPCPPCEASVTRQCHCGRTRITAKCIADETQFQCQSICGREMQCGVHRCERQCHVDDDGHLCKFEIEQSCWCNQSTRTVLCGTDQSTVDKYGCGGVCGQLKNCGNHNCESLCHEGACSDCADMPDKVKHCCCGKKRYEHLSDVRQSCLDPIPSCGDICGKQYDACGHRCACVCHGGPCESCPGTSAVKCRCGSSVQSVKCASDEVVQCKQRCKEKLLCGRHRCDKQCCDSEVHVCLLECGRVLSCKEHRCDRECGHAGLCPSCPNVSFEELFCDCGATFTLPPIACGQRPPPCPRLCAREHSCDHPVRHNCHTDPDCPPCTELVSKPCPGGHSDYANVPCFRPVTTCGLPCGKALSDCAHSCVKLCHDGACGDRSGNLRCTQPCTVPRQACPHACAAPCHSGDCAAVIGPCLVLVTVTCQCGLRIVTVQCTQLSDDLSLDAHGLRRHTDTGALILDCDRDCDRALVTSQQFHRLTIAYDNRSSAKVALDGSLSCVQRCVAATCHHGPPSLTKACVNVSSLCLQKYYGPYLEQYVRLNFVFAVAVEKVFRGFMDQARCSAEASHQFSALTAERAQFVRRFSCCYKLICLKSYNEDDTVNVVVRANRDNYVCMKVPLTTRIEEKYFKIL